VFVYTEYITAVDRWMSVLFMYIKPYLYANGGPIIMVQVETFASIHSYNKRLFTKGFLVFTTHFF